MIDVDIESERILKEYIEGSTIFELVKSDCMKSEYIEQIKAMSYRGSFQNGKELTLCHRKDGTIKVGC